MAGAAVEFLAPCPRGHPGAWWRTALREVVGSAGWDVLGVQSPTHAVRCGRCDDEDSAAGAGAAGPLS